MEMDEKTEANSDKIDESVNILLNITEELASDISESDTKIILYPLESMSKQILNFIEKHMTLKVKKNLNNFWVKQNMTAKLEKLNKIRSDCDKLEYSDVPENDIDILNYIKAKLLLQHQKYLEKELKLSKQESSSYKETLTDWSKKVSDQVDAIEKLH